MEIKTIKCKLCNKKLGSAIQGCSCHKKHKPLKKGLEITGMTNEDTPFENKYKEVKNE